MVKGEKKLLVPTSVYPGSHRHFQYYRFNDFLSKPIVKDK
jgi:hypothetical protein